MANTYEHRLVPIFPDRPDPELIDELRDYIKDFGDPENHPSISTSQAFDLDKADILLEFSVPRKKRTNLDQIPCPICSPNSGKFLSGYLVYFPKESCIRVVGNECGDKISAEWSKIKRQFIQTKRDQQAEQFVLDNLIHVEELLETTQTLVEAISVCRRFWHEFKKAAPSAKRALFNASKDGGLFIQRRKRSAEKLNKSSDAFQNHSVELVGNLKGEEIFQLSPPNQKLLKDTAQYLSLLQAGGKGSNHVERAKSFKASEIRSIERQVRKARETIETAQLLVTSYLDFFEEDNLGTINEWARHPSVNPNFTLSITANREYLVIDISGDDPTAVYVASLLRMTDMMDKVSQQSDSVAS